MGSGYVSAEPSAPLVLCAWCGCDAAADGHASDCPERRKADAALGRWVRENYGVLVTTRDEGFTCQMCGASALFASDIRHTCQLGIKSAT